MTVEITIRVPDTLERDLRRFRDRLPEALERGLRELMAEGAEIGQDENAIVALLASGPTPEQVLALQPSRKLQTRVSELLASNKQGELGREEETELERYLMLEHLVRLAKSYALQRTMKQS
jgi:hypothetical protein